MTTGWQTGPNDFPWPPANLQVVSPMFTGAFDLRWDDPSLLNTGPTSVQQAAGATVTVLGVPQVVTTSSGTITITTSPIPVGETITIDGIEITSIAGARPAGSDQFNGLLGSPSLIAASVAEAINDGSIAGFGVATATVLGNIVTVTAVLPGASGDDIGLATSTNDILTSYHLSGGFDATTLTIGLAVLTATVEDRVSGELNFKVGPTSYDTAQSIADAINDPENFISYVSATSGGDVTNITATIVGSEGNGIVLRTTSSTLVLSGSNLSGGTGGDCNGRSNTRWDIVGVNIYRSDNGERGPYIRVNRFPIGSLFYRDLTDNTFIENEVVRWDGSWLSKGDAPNSYRWTFRTVFFPVVKPNETPPIYQNTRLVAIPANAPSDVILRVDGVVVPVSDVYGPTGEITLINQPTWDIAQEKVIPPVIPTETSAVTISYRYGANQVQSTLDRTTQSFYRVTTVALDPSKPSGYAETPLAYSPPVSVSQVETIDYIWREAVRRNLWILQQGGERVKLFKRKVSGIPCPCRIEERTLEYGQQPSNRCHTCFPPGTLVRTNIGYRAIEQIKPGDLVLTLGGRYEPVTQVFSKKYIGDLVEIKPTVSSSSILATPEHPMLVLRGSHHKKIPCGPKCNSYIANGDGMASRYDIRLVPSGKWWARCTVNDGPRVSLGTHTSEEEARYAIDTYRSTHKIAGHVLTWDDASHIREKDWLVSAWPHQIIDMNSIDIPQAYLKQTHLGSPRMGATSFTVDADFLWMVGLYLAEGSTGTRTVVFSLHQDEKIYQDRLFSFFTKYGFKPKLEKKKSLGVNVVISSTTLSNWFADIFGHGCENKKIPEYLMSLPNEKLWNLLLGVWDGDGSKSDNEITQTSEILALQLMEILHRAGEQPLLRTYHNKSLTAKGNIRKVCFSVNWSEDTKVNHNRKGRWDFSGSLLTQNRSFSTQGYDGLVYNLEVAGNHTYVVQGVVVHNCLGSGFVGGFDGPIDIIVAPDDAERSVAQGPNGRNLEHTYEVWTGPSPAITQRDFVVKQTGERYSIGPVRRPSMRGLPLQQHFNIAYLDEQDIRYRMPVNGITELPWPQTRPTDPNTPCNPQPPHPVGFDYQATPMETENPNVPDGREVRGRTPVWGNTTY